MVRLVATVSDNTSSLWPPSNSSLHLQVALTLAALDCGLGFSSVVLN